MDIILPLLATDLDRYLRLQRPTFERFYADLGATWILCRPGEVKTIRDATAHLAAIRVLNERTVVPELLPGRWTQRVAPHATGWRVQQLIKLAMLERMNVNFTLVTDADVIAVRSVSDADLVINGRAIRPRDPAPPGRGWEQQAGRVLRMEPLEYMAAVTPSVLCPQAVRLLAKHVQRTARSNRSRRRRMLMVAALGRSWRAKLLGAIPWTEYQLYDTFLVRSGLFDRFHVRIEDQSLYGNSVWEEPQFAAWNPNDEEASSFFFSVVQARRGIPVEAIEDKLYNARLLQPIDSGSSRSPSSRFRG